MDKASSRNMMIGIYHKSFMYKIIRYEVNKAYPNSEKFQIGLFCPLEGRLGLT